MFLKLINFTFGIHLMRERENQNQERTKDHCYRSDKLYCAFKAHGEAGKRKCIVAFFKLSKIEVKYFNKFQ